MSFLEDDLGLMHHLGWTSMCQLLRRELDLRSCGGTESISGYICSFKQKFIV